MKFPVLVSYAYAMKNEEHFKIIADHPDIELLLDCGAFTAKSTGREIRLDDYCSFLDRYKDKLFAYLALDVVGDPVGTEANLQEMLKNGYKPVPVHVLGDDERRMDELFEMSDYVACAGLRRPGKGHCPRSYVKAKMKWAKGRKVHWLGYVVEDMIARFKPYSCDSASFNSSAIWGQLHVYMGRGEWLSSVRYDHNIEKLFNHRRALAAVYQTGVTREQIKNRANWFNKNGVTSVAHHVTTDSWVRYVIDIRKRYGTRIFLAVGVGKDHSTRLIDYVEKHIAKLRLDSTAV